MQPNTRALLDIIATAIDGYVQSNEVSVFDILFCLDKLGHDITEEFIRQFPELQYDLANLVESRH